MNNRRKSGLSIVCLLLLWTAIPIHHAFGGIVFGPKEYVRGSGAPVMITDNFTATPCSEYRLEVYNGGLEDAATELVSATVIYLNGVLEVGAQNFNQNVSYVEMAVTLQADNTFQVEVRGKPGGMLTLQIVSTDTAAPVPDIDPLPDIEGEGSVTVSTIPTATDNCAGSINATTTDPLTYSTVGEHTITWTYDDGNDNTFTQTQTVRVTDTVAPVADVDPLPTVTGECSATLTTTPTATDAIAGLITGTTTDPLVYSDQGIYTVTWTYDDGNGNTSSQPQTVIVDDVTAPVPDVDPLPDVEGEGSVTVSTIPTATDNCVGTINATTTDPLTYSTVGEHTINWTYDDGNGNTLTRQQTVRVTDTAAPVADIDPLPTVTGECSATITTTPTATDAIAGLITGTTTDSLVYTDQGIYTVTWTYDDGNGNTATQAQSVIVDDVTAPVPDVDPLPDVEGEGSVTVSTIPTATDNCAGSINATTTNPLTYSTAGEHYITWTYDDGNGNISTQQQTVRVTDTAAPVADIDPLPTVTGECSATITTTPTATDAIAGLITGTTTDSLVYTDQGIYTVTWTYDDGNGNTATQTQSVVVDDVTAPVPDVDPLPDIEGEGSVTVSTIPTATDNCVGAVSATTTDPLTYTTVGEHYITWTYDDGNGNTSTQQQTARVTETTALFIEITSPSDGESFSTTAIVVSGNIDAAVTEVSVNGTNATIAGTTFTAQISLSQGNNTIEAIAGDGVGGSATDTITVFADSLPPQISISSPSDGQHVTTSTVDIAGVVNESVTSVLVNASPATLNGNAFSVLGLPLNNCENIIDITATDLLGNSSTISITVFNDSQPPLVTEESGYLVGHVYEYGTETAIEGATVTVEGLCGSVLTDVDGRYVFPVTDFPSYSPTRKFLVSVEKEGYTEINRLAEGVITKEAAIEPVYLTAKDLQVTTITVSSGGLAVNSAGNTEVIFPAGSVPNDIDVTITMYDSEEQLPAPLPPGQLLYAIGLFQPEGTIFNQPVTVRLPNTYNMPAGTEVPCVDYDTDKKVWNFVDNGVVSADELFIELEVQHFSRYGATWIPTIEDADPVDPAPGDDDIKNNTPNAASSGDEEKDCGASAVSLKRGTLRLSHSTVSYRSMGTDRGLDLIYDSSTALPQKVISFDVSGNRTSKYTKVDFIGLGHHRKIYLTADEGKHSLLMEAKDVNGEWLKDGVYSYHFGVENYFDVNRSTQVSQGNWVDTMVEKKWSTDTGSQLVVNNQKDSSFGSGWQVGQISRLINDRAHGPLVIEGNAKTTRFESSVYWIDTIVGGNFADGIDATKVYLNNPTSIAVDSAGNIYVVSGNRIRRVDTNGIITTVAGNGSDEFSGDGGPATQASMSPSGVAVDSAGNIYIGTYNARVCKVDTNGILTTVAGNGTRDFSGDGGPATEASLNWRTGVAVDSNGNLYIADYSNHRIRKVDTNGIITTVAGNGTPGFSGDGGDATQASLNNPTYITLDSAGNIYVADSGNYRVRKIDTNGIITTVAGGGNPVWPDIGDGGPAVDARLYAPEGISLDSAGNIHIVDATTARIRKVDSNGIITTVVGNGSYGFSGDGGPATEASMRNPEGVALDSAGNIYIADRSNNRIRKVDNGGIITTIAGSWLYGFSGDGGDAKQAKLHNPEEVTVDSKGNLYIIDSYNNRIRKVNNSGIINTVAGSGDWGFSGDGGPAVEASLDTPEGIAVDSIGNIFIADTWNNRIRKVDTNGVITTIAGNGSSGFSGDGGDAKLASLYRPKSLALDSAGNIYIADYYNYRIRKIDTNGIITTVAGNGSSGFSGDGGDAKLASLGQLYDIAVDNAGNIYIADRSNNRIRKVGNNGIITTVAGNGNSGFSGDGGLATEASLRLPEGVAVDSAGNIYIAGTSIGRIRKVDNSGIINTVAGGGNPIWPDIGDGGEATQAIINNPEDVAVDAEGNLYVVDPYNSIIRVCSYHLALTATNAYLLSQDGESELELYEDGTAVWTHKNGIITYFDESGLQTSTVDRNGNITTYEYDTNGRLFKIIDTVGQETTFSYGTDGKIDSIANPAGTTLFDHDINGNLISITDPDGAVTTYAYNDPSYAHLLTDKTGPNNKTTNYYYNDHGQIESTVVPTGETRYYYPADSLGLFNDLPAGEGFKANPAAPVTPQPSTMTDGKGYTKTYQTDGEGATLEFTDAVGNTTLYSRDEFSRITKITEPNGSRISMTYDEIGNLTSRTVEGLNATTSYAYSSDFNKITSVTGPLGNNTHFSYDTKGNLTTITNAQGKNTVMTYYANGLLNTLTDTMYRTTTYQYDPTTGNLSKVIYPDLTETSYTSDPKGNVTSMTDPELKVTTYGYDAMNRVTLVNSEIGNTYYTYESSCGCPVGKKRNLTTITNAEGKRTYFDYNSIGQVTTVTNHIGQTKVFQYDRNRNLSTLTNARNQDIIYTYDEANRLIGKTTPDDTVSYQYDANSNITLMNDSDSGLSMEYDPYGRLTAVNTQISATQPSSSVTYGYDIAGRVTLMNNSLHPSPTTYVYDNLNRLDYMVTGAGETINNSYDDLGRRTGLELPNGVTTGYTFNNMGRLTDLVHQLGATTIDNYSYTYDYAGNRDTMTDQDGTHNYIYDDLYRLLSATHPAPQQPQNPDESFTYDNVGNRETSHLSTSYTHDDVNRLTQDDSYDYTYDADGNMTSKTDRITSDTTAYTFDAENRLTRIDLPDITIITYAYDTMGRRIEKYVDGTIKRYIYDREDILLELDGTNIVRAYYTHGQGIDEPLIMERDTDANGTLDQKVFYHADGLGSINFLTDNTGAIVQTYLYDSFGNIVDQTGAVVNPYTYSGREFDSESGLYYYRARYYDAQIGRFISEDPIGFKGGSNFYSYTFNNPINFIDPSGKLTPFWHSVITFLAAINSGHGTIDSLKMAMNVVAEDCNSLETDASAANIHAMAGYDPSLGGYQTRDEALAATYDIIQTGPLSSALHAGQDLPGHNGDSMASFGWNSSTFRHVLKDMAPSFSTIFKAYYISKGILHERDSKK